MITRRLFLKLSGGAVLASTISLSGVEAAIDYFNMTGEKVWVGFRHIARNSTIKIFDAETMRPIWHKPQVHGGIDILAPKGEREIIMEIEKEGYETFHNRRSFDCDVTIVVNQPRVLLETRGVH